MASAILQFPYEIPKLPYEWNALEPYIDSRTMEVHHTKHHQTYVDKLNQALAGTDLTKQSLENLLRKVSKHGSAVRNHGGGHYNHSLFWPMLSATAGKKPVSTLAAAINKKFGSLNRFREEFSQAATAHFGSGWAWLCIDKHGNLFVCTTPNQDNPIMDVVDPSCQGTPILGLDVWEHAYYLQYQNRRSAYIEAFWNIVNWEEVNRRFEAAQKKLN
jgi:Fe-Mn family superoxide dismutase